MYMEDIKLFAKNKKKELKNLIKAMKIYSDERGM